MQMETVLEPSWVALLSRPKGSKGTKGDGHHQKARGEPAPGDQRSTETRTIPRRGKGGVGWAWVDGRTDGRTLSWCARVYYCCAAQGPASAARCLDDALAGCHASNKFGGGRAQASKSRRPCALDDDRTLCPMLRLAWVVPTPKGPSKSRKWRRPGGRLVRRSSPFAPRRAEFPLMGADAATEGLAESG